MPIPQDLETILNETYRLIENINPADTQNTAIKTILKTLSLSTDRTDKQLFLCIAIDLKSKALRPEIVKEALVEATKGVTKSRTKKSSIKSEVVSFTKSKKVLDYFPEESSIKPYLSSFASNDSQQYARVMSLKGYAKNVVGKNGITVDKDLSEEKLLYKLKDWNTINIYQLSSGTGFVFVFPKTKLTDILKNTTISNKTNYLCDGLGLNMQGVSDKKFIYFTFQTNSNTYQPCFINGNWSDGTEGNPFYLSYYKYDDYGRTFAMTGDPNNSFQERILIGFQSHLPTMTIQAALLPDDLEKQNLDTTSDKLIDEGIKRWKKA